MSIITAAPQGKQPPARLVPAQAPRAPDADCRCERPRRGGRAGKDDGLGRFFDRVACTRRRPGRAAQTFSVPNCVRSSHERRQVVVVMDSLTEIDQGKHKEPQPLRLEVTSPFCSGSIIVRRGMGAGWGRLDGVGSPCTRLFGSSVEALQPRLPDHSFWLGRQPFPLRRTLDLRCDNGRGALSPAEPGAGEPG